MWVRSSFGDKNATEATAAMPAPRRRPRQTFRTAAAAPRPAGAGGGLWAERHRPRDCCHLAVHRAKVDEVVRWIESTRRSLEDDTPVSPFLLVTGPAGCGKSTCLRCVADKLNTQVLEWVNPAGGRYQRDAAFRDDEPWEGPGDTVTPEGQLRQFADFMVRANRYRPVATSGDSSVLAPGGGASRLVLVDDLPSALALRRDEFYATLHRYSRGARSPCVFVLSDGGGARSELSTLSVFPDGVQSELGMHQITFRPLTNKQLVSAMERVLAVEAAGSGGATHPGRASLDQLAAAAAGDVRAAINALQFLCCQGDPSSGRPPEKRPRQQRPQRQNTEQLATSGRDAALGLFRALGKIIYAKRDTSGPEPAPLPLHLSGQLRLPLLEHQPEGVCARAGVQPDTLVTHLHHNYAAFCRRLEHAVTSAIYLSEADLLTADWQSRAATLAYGSSVAARGVMFARPETVTLGFRQFGQPRLTSVEQQRLKRLEILRVSFADWRVSHEQLVTELLPFLDKRAPGHRTNLSVLPDHDVGFYRHLHKPTLERIDCSDDEEYEHITIEEYVD